MAGRPPTIRQPGGKRGPAPMPTALKILTGMDKNQPGRVNKREPKPGGVVEPPPYLSPKAREVWDEVAPSMIRTGVLTVWDVPIFVELCEALVITRMARVKVMREMLGQDIAADKPSNAPMNAWFKAVAIINTIGGKYGMTPADRSRLVQLDSEATRAASADLLSG